MNRYSSQPTAAIRQARGKLMAALANPRLVAANREQVVRYIADADAELLSRDSGRREVHRKVVAPYEYKLAKTGAYDGWIG